MGRRYNTRHNRTQSRYRDKRESDRYGQYREGKQITPDLVAGNVSRKKEDGK